MLPTDFDLTRSRELHLADHQRLHGRYNSTPSLANYAPANNDWTQALTTALADAKTAKRVLTIPDGVYHLYGNVTIDWPVAASPEAWVYVHNGASVILDGLQCRVLSLPRLVKSDTAWWNRGVGSDVGLTIRNCANCRIDVPQVYGFSTNLLVLGDGAGCAQLHMTGLLLNGGYVGVRMESRNEGWAQENTLEFAGISLGYDLAAQSGANPVPGSCHIQHVGEDTNSNIFRASLEDDSVEWRVHNEQAHENVYDCRWESHTDPKRAAVYFGSGYANVISGRSVEHVVVEKGYTGTRNCTERYDSDGSLIRTPV